MGGHEHDDNAPTGPDDTRHHEAFDPTPISGPVEGEPLTPMWLPALGVALMVLLPLWWLAGEHDGDAAVPATSASAAVGTASATASAASPAVKRPSSKRPRSKRPAGPTTKKSPRGKPDPRAAGSGSPGDARTLSPEQLRRLRERLKNEKQGK